MAKVCTVQYRHRVTHSDVEAVFAHLDKWPIDFRARCLEESRISDSYVTIMWETRSDQLHTITDGAYLSSYREHHGD
jgi:hypothetical protein